VVEGWIFKVGICSLRAKGYVVNDTKDITVTFFNYGRICICYSFLQGRIISVNEITTLALGGQYPMIVRHIRLNFS